MVALAWSTYVPAALSNFLRNELEKRGWTQQKLAEVSGLQKGGVNYILKNPESKPDLETLQRLANGLGISLGRILVVSGYELGDDDRHPESDRIAILLDAMPELAPMIEGLMEFSPSERQKILGYIEGQLEARDRKKRRHV